MNKVISVIIKILGYLLICFGVFGGASTIFYYGIDIYYFIVLFLSIGVGSFLVWIAKKIKNHVVVFNAKKIKKFLLKIVLSLVIIVCPIIVCGELSIEFEGLTTFFYIPFYLIIGIYYLYLIWMRKNISGEDILFFPLLTKISLYNEITNPYELRKKLLFNVAPLLITTVLLSLIIALNSEYSYNYEDENRGISIEDVILFLPVIGWIIYFFLSYGHKWLNAKK